MEMYIVKKSLFIFYITYIYSKPGRV